jgi:8-oxo-dGTP pyrophosphatase MutT (NUDIX family)
MGPGPSKPLRQVLGLSMLERNVLPLLAEGFGRIVVVVPAAATDLLDWCTRRGRALAERAGARLEVHVERQARGTSGALDALPADTDAAVLTYADNLTDLSRSTLLDAHGSFGADLTVASHHEPFRLPYGRVSSADGWLTSYEEKPTIEVEVASGLYVVSAAAARARPALGRFDMPELVRLRTTETARVATFRHAAAWIDVNEPAALTRADEKVADTPTLDAWLSDETARIEVVDAVVRCDGQWLLEARPNASKLSPGLWDTPGGKLEPGEAPRDALSRELAEELGLVDPSARAAGVFDELDPTAGWVRHHLFVVDLQDVRQVRAAEGQTLRWWSDGALPRPLATAAERGRARASHPLCTERGVRSNETLRPQNEERFGARDALHAPRDPTLE